LSAIGLLKRKIIALVIFICQSLVHQHITDRFPKDNKYIQETFALLKVPLLKICGTSFSVLFTFGFIGCGSGRTSPYGVQSGGDAVQSEILIAGSQPGPTPFIANLQLSGQSLADLTSIAFTIAPKPNTVSLPVHVTWNVAALTNRGYIQGNSINLPVFGLYSAYDNAVTLNLAFEDGSTQQLQYTISTQSYTDPTGVYTSPTIIKARAAGSTLGFNYFVLKSELNSPVVVDTDGQVRWVVPAASPTGSAYFSNGQFILGNSNTLGVTLLQFDGTSTQLNPGLPQGAASFTHNIDSGKTSVLAEFNGNDSLGDSIDDIVSEITPFSSDPPLQTFDMATILSAYMQSQGDDPTAFVRPGIDWFHVNASTYDPSDDTVIVSSRENFLIKLKYTTQEIVWIFGDPTKYWYTFPSLRAKALTLAAGGLYPIGQHGVSITSDGYIMVMNDGLGSLNQPAGEPAGLTRSYTAVSAYSINASAMTAQEVWDFNYNQSIFSALCGSSYEAPGKTYLVDFPTADNYLQARLVGLDPNHNVVFDFQYSSPQDCVTGWNAIPVALEALQITD
jgi:arylsulfate sulfotransferase